MAAAPGEALVELAEAQAEGLVGDRAPAAPEAAGAAAPASAVPRQ
jgi:hypothetical protein